MRISLATLLSPGFLGQSLFHPKLAKLPNGRLLMTVQTISGSDSYGPLLQSFSQDGGFQWSAPVPIPTLGWSEPRTGGIVEGVCDVVPDVDPATGLALAVGHTVFYRNDRFFDTLGFFNGGEKHPEFRRLGVYSIMDDNGQWTPRRLFDFPEFNDYECITCGSSQKIIHPDSTWLIPFNGRLAGEEYFHVLICKLDFNGEKFTLAEHGSPLRLENGRGLLEPSLFEHEGKIWLTMRAEDGHAYFSTSTDGIHFPSITPWTFADGSPLETSTTQQHFARLGERLYLIYTRNAGYNEKVFRFRAPLFMAEIDTEKGALKAETEVVALPADGDFTDPEGVGVSGNFLPCSLSADELLISDAFIRPYRGYVGLTQIARIKA